MKVLIILILLSGLSMSMDPPAIEWVEVHGSLFYDVHETYDGNIIVAGRRWSDYARTLFLFDPTGNLIWEASVYPTDCRTQAVVETFDGGFAGTGYGLPSESSTQASLSIYKVSSSGDSLWARLFDLPDGKRGEGFDIIQLPDSGFAVCGELDPVSDMRQGWVLRMDSQGDTLWTREWGWEYNDIALSVLYVESGLTVLMHGNTATTPGGPHLVRYDMDGNLVWETSIEMLAGEYAQTMCEASDNGLLLLTGYIPLVVHTDYEGNPDWWQAPQGWAQDIGYSIDTTMDGGFVVGVDAGNEPGAVEGMCGVVSRHSVTGEIEWWDYVYEESCTAIHCVRQLSEGGYIAAGRAYNSGYQGFLMKYAPETGISYADPLNSLDIGGSPNPCSSVLSVNFNLPEAGYASIQIFDLSGRLVSSVADGDFPSGNCSVEWEVPDRVSSGCYLIRLYTAGGTVSERCVLLN